MTDIPRWRERAKQKLEGYFHDQTFPRFTLSLIIMATGIFGFGISYFLLHAGMREMWVRYPIAVVGAYGIFILMLRVWVAFEKRRIDPEELAALEALQQGTDYRPGIENSGSLSRKHSWLDFVDLPVDGFGEGCLPLILIGAVIGIALLLFGVVAQAPALLAEVFVDVVL
ncbi:MAG: hypothetical protein ABIP97_09965, partial [Chthoniobacterales bacterium]